MFAIKVYIREEGKRRRYWIIDERLTGLYPLIGNPFGEALLFGLFSPEKHKHGGRARVLIFFPWLAREAAGVYANRDLGDTPETVPCLLFASARRGCPHLKSESPPRMRVNTSLLFGLPLSRPLCFYFPRRTGASAAGLGFYLRGISPGGLRD